MARDVIKKALRTTCIENIKLKIIKIRTGCQYVGCFYYSQKPKLGRTKPSTGPRVGHSCYRLFSEEICNEYAAQTLFFQSQAFPTENKPKVLKKARISKSGFKKAKLATLLQRSRMSESRD